MICSTGLLRKWAPLWTLLCMYLPIILAFGSYLDSHSTPTFFSLGLVVHPCWVQLLVNTLLKERFCSFWPELLLAPGTSTSSTATPCAGTNQDDAHFHDNLDNCYPGEPWLHVNILPTDNSLCLHSVCFHSNCTLTFSFNPEVRS